MFHFFPFALFSGNKAQDDGIRVYLRDTDANKVNFVLNLIPSFSKFSNTNLNSRIPKLYRVKLGLKLKKMFRLPNFP